MEARRETNEALHDAQCEELRDLGGQTGLNQLELEVTPLADGKQMKRKQHAHARNAGKADGVPQLAPDAVVAREQVVSWTVCVMWSVTWYR